MAQRETFSAGPADVSTTGGQRGRSGDLSRPSPEDGHRLIGAFLSIEQPALREAIVNFVMELSAIYDKHQ